MSEEQLLGNEHSAEPTPEPPKTYDGDISGLREAARDLLFQGRAKTGGRVKGSRNKLSMAFVEALAKEFNDYGEEAIRIMRVENPSDFVKTIAAIIPKEFIGELPPIALHTIQRTIVDPKVIEHEPAIDGAASNNLTN